MSERPRDAELAPEITAEISERVAQLRLETSRVVDGLLTGLHRSPRRGASVVFVEHRDYRPGDDPRLLDWRAYARNDRHVTKHFEQETALTLHLWLDGSASMRFGEGSREKARYAAALLASFARLAHEQRDAVAALRFDEQLRDALPARTSRSHLDAIFTLLAAPPAARGGTSLRALEQAAERLTRRSLVFLATDGLDFDEGAWAAVDRLASHGHDVRVFQVLTADELELPGDAPALFEGLEGEPSVQIDPGAIREAYRAEVRAHIEACRDRLVRAGADHQLVVTDERLVEVVARALAPRSRGASHVSPGARARWA